MSRFCDVCVRVDRSSCFYAARRFLIFFGVFTSFRCFVVYRSALSRGSAFIAGWAWRSRTQPLTSTWAPRANAPTGWTWSYKITSPTMTLSTSKWVSSRFIWRSSFLQTTNCNLLKIFLYQFQNNNLRTFQHPKANFSHCAQCFGGVLNMICIVLDKLWCSLAEDFQHWCGMCIEQWHSIC